MRYKFSHIENKIYFKKNKIYQCLYQNLGQRGTIVAHNTGKIYNDLLLPSFSFSNAPLHKAIARRKRFFTQVIKIQEPVLNITDMQREALMKSLIIFVTASY